MAKRVRLRTRPATFLLDRIAPWFGGKRLQYQLRNALACAHDIRGTDRLVSGDKDKAAGSGFHRRPGDIQCTQNVIGYTLAGVVLDHWDMFVGRSVIDGVGG